MATLFEILKMLNVLAIGVSQLALKGWILEFNVYLMSDYNQAIN